MTNRRIDRLQKTIVSCTKCARLVAWREQVAKQKVRRFADQPYWGKPVPSFGDPAARLLIVGLAPAAQGANRTGRMFTGDRSGDWLFEALFENGFANQPHASDAQDGLKLQDCYITASLHCAPPQNKPTAAERENCFEYLTEELYLLQKVVVIVVLGRIAFDTTLKALKVGSDITFRSRPQFGHGAVYQVLESTTLISSYHPSQQNTFTGRLTKPMFRSIFERARRVIGANDL